MTDDPVEVTLRNKESTFADQEANVKTLPFKKEVLKINRNTHTRLTDSIFYTNPDESTIQLTVPAHSTVMFTPALSAAWYDTNFCEVILRRKERADTLRLQVGQYNRYDVSDPENNFKTTGGVVQNIFYYDYKERD